MERGKKRARKERGKAKNQHGIIQASLRREEKRLRTLEHKAAMCESCERPKIHCPCGRTTKKGKPRARTALEQANAEVASVQRHGTLTAAVKQAGQERDCQWCTEILGVGSLVCKNDDCMILRLHERRATFCASCKDMLKTYECIFNEERGLCPSCTWDETEETRVSLLAMKCAVFFCMESSGIAYKEWSLQSSVRSEDLAFECPSHVVCEMVGTYDEEPITIKDYTMESTKPLCVNVRTRFNVWDVCQEWRSQKEVLKLTIPFHAKGFQDMEDGLYVFKGKFAVFKGTRTISGIQQILDIVTKCKRGRHGSVMGAMTARVLDDKPRGLCGGAFVNKATHPLVGCHQYFPSSQNSFTVRSDGRVAYRPRHIAKARALGKLDPLVFDVDEAKALCATRSSLKQSIIDPGNAFLTTKVILDATMQGDVSMYKDTHQGPNKFVAMKLVPSARLLVSLMKDSVNEASQAIEATNKCSQELVGEDAIDHDLKFCEQEVFKLCNVSAACHLDAKGEVTPGCTRVSALYALPYINVKVIEKLNKKCGGGLAGDKSDADQTKFAFGLIELLNRPNGLARHFFPTLGMRTDLTWKAYYCEGDNEVKLQVSSLVCPSSSLAHAVTYKSVDMIIAQNEGMTRVEATARQKERIGVSTHGNWGSEAKKARKAKKVK